MSQYPAGAEDQVIAGVLDYVDHSAQWQFVGHGHRPFKPFAEIDLNEIDGVIGVFFERDWAEAVREAGIAAVDAGAAFEQPILPRITNDDRAIGRMGGEFLLEKGLPHLAFLTTGSWWFFSQRLAGFKQVMDDAGRPLHVESLAGPAPIEACARWLEQLPKPIGIMAGIDFLAVHVVDAARQLGLRVPDDVAVLGVGDDRWASAVAAVPLSSIQMNMRQVGYRAAQLLDGLLAGESPTPAQYLPPVGLVQRRSTDIVFADDPLVRRALCFIREHVTEGINVEDVLAEVGVSRATLVKRMTRATGHVPRDAISRARIEVAKQLLVTTDATMEQIARRCGFRQQSHFQQVFKRLTDTTPGQFRHDSDQRSEASIPDASA